MPPSRNRHSAQRVFTWDKIKMALAAAEEGFYIWNIKTGVIHYTDRCLTMMGASRKEKAPNIFTQPELTIHEEDQAFAKQWLSEPEGWHLMELCCGDGSGGTER